MWLYHPAFTAAASELRGIALYWRLRLAESSFINGELAAWDFTEGDFFIDVFYVDTLWRACEVM